jgi:hypothetical protein
MIRGHPAVGTCARIWFPKVPGAYVVVSMEEDLFMLRKVGSINIKMYESRSVQIQRISFQPLLNWCGGRIRSAVGWLIG